MQCKVKHFAAYNSDGRLGEKRSLLKNCCDSISSCFYRSGEGMMGSREAQCPLRQRCTTWESRMGYLPRAAWEAYRGTWRLDEWKGWLQGKWKFKIPQWLWTTHSVSTIFLTHSSLSLLSLFPLPAICFSAASLNCVKLDFSHTNNR